MPEIGAITVEFDDTPVDGEKSKGITSNWAFDHKADPAAHHEKTELDDAPVDGETERGVTSNWAYNHAANKDAHHAVFVDRGDPTGYDFIASDHTVCGVWTDMDLSAIVPAGALAVLIKFGGYRADIVTNFQLRKKGNSNEYNVSTINMQVENVWVYADLIVPLPPSRIIQYKQYQVWNESNLTVKGWWI